MIILLILGCLKKEFKNMKFEVQQTHQNYECWKTGIEINLFLNDKYLSAMTHPKKDITI